MGNPSGALAEPRSEEGSNDGFRVVQRTIMRADTELDVRGLYMGAVTSMASSADASSGRSGSDRRSDDDSRDSSRDSSPTADTGIIGYGRVDDDNNTVAESGRRITFGTYFNAFPASYWRRWTDHPVRPARGPAPRRGVADRLPVDRARATCCAPTSLPVDTDDDRRPSRSTCR